MTTQEYIYRKVPEYYDTMYLDGFTSDEIMYAHHRMMMRKIAERKALNKERSIFENIKITSEVNIK